MKDYRFERAARANRSKALLFTAACHLILILALFPDTRASIQSYIPEKLQILVGMGQPDAQAAPAETATVQQDVP